MNNSQTSQDFIQTVNILLDNELGPDATREMLEKINGNADYRELLTQEKQFRAFVRSRIHRKPAPAALLQSIKEKIHSTSNGRSI